MFQNIARDFEEARANNKQGFQSQNEDVEFNKTEGIHKYLNKKYIIIYILAICVSMVQLGANMEVAPFGLAFIMAVLANCIPIGIVSIITVATTVIACGGQATLSLILSLLIIFASLLLKSPKYEEEDNEKRKLGRRLLITTIIVQVVTLFFKEVYVYEILLSFVYCVATFIFYKIFVNAIPAITSIGEKKAYTIEEVIAASLLISIAATALGDFKILGYSIRNIICILVVLVMGWKNGVLVGATTGVTVGTVLGVLGASEPIMVAAYALSGMVAGIFNKFGKIGVIIGFVIGNVILTYVANGNTRIIISTQEILIAALGLIAIPKSMKINITDIVPDEKLLPETFGRTLEESRDTIDKLNTMSETISEIAKTYQEAAATIVDEEELKKQEEENRKIFERELENNIEGMEDNILFDDIYAPEGENEIIGEIFSFLLENEKIQRKELLKILANHNNFIAGSEEDYIEESVEEDIARMLKAINNAYRVSKMNFIWKKKIDENKKAVSNQLSEVSKAIGDLAGKINEEEQNQIEDKFKTQKEEIKTLLEQKEINISDIRIRKANTGRMEVKLSTQTCQDVDNECYDIKKIAKILDKVLSEQMILQKQECGLRINKNECVFTFMSKDKQSVQIGVAQTAKDGNVISGDTNLQVRLEDGKYLLAISDGMGSGKQARKSSKMAIGMLEKLLTSGFEKDTSLKLINSALNSVFTSNPESDMYATLDIGILDLYAKNLEFIKNGAGPTFIKNGKDVQILKSVALPTGIIEDVDLIVYDRDIQNGDIIVMCSDGIIDSTTEYTNKELWLKFLLEEINSTDVQKIADIIMQEAIDNSYGVAKDDMTVIVAKIQENVI